MAIYVIGINHRTAPVDVRERMAFAESAIPTALERLRAAGLAQE